MRTDRTLRDLQNLSYEQLKAGKPSKVEIQLNADRGREPPSYPWFSIETNPPKDGKSLGYRTTYRLQGDRISPLAAAMLMEAYGEFKRNI